MITNEQLAFIDTIPGEGSADGYPDSLIEDAVARAFDGKVPPDGEKKAVILLGAPGSGKTDTALRGLAQMAAREHWVFVGYNEGGAEEHFPPVQAALNAAGDLPSRLAAAVTFRPPTRFIQNAMFKSALRGGYNVLIDTTSSGPGTRHMVNALRQTGYRHVAISGMAAPFAISAERAMARRRPATLAEDIVGKRIGVLEQMSKHEQVVDRFSLSYNPVNDVVPVGALVIENHALVWHDPKVLTAMIGDLAADRDAIAAHLRRIPAEPDFADIDAVMARYDAARAAANEFLSWSRDVQPAPPWPGGPVL